MSQPLPIAKFRFLESSEVEAFDLKSKLADAPKGYILEVDLHYSAHLHDMHNDYPLAPEKVAVRADILSDYSNGLAEKLKVKYNAKMPAKLIPNFMDKKIMLSIIEICNITLLWEWMSLKFTKCCNLIKRNGSNHISSLTQSKGRPQPLRLRKIFLN